MFAATIIFYQLARSRYCGSRGAKWRRSFSLQPRFRLVDDPDLLAFAADGRSAGIARQNQKFKVTHYPEDVSGA